MSWKKKLKKWLGPLLWAAGMPALYFLPKEHALLAYLPAMLLQFYEWGHHDGWMEGFQRCDMLNRPFMELDQKRILELAKKLAERGKPN